MSTKFTMTANQKNYSDIREKLISSKILLKKFEEAVDKLDVNVKISDDIEIEPHSTFYGYMNCLVSMGAFSYTNSPLPDGVRVGRYCSIGANLQIMGAEHFTDWISTSPQFYVGNHFSQDVLPKSISHISRSRINISIGNDVWIGQNVVIKKNCRIGSGSILAAHSVITKDVDDFCIVGGNPARNIRYRFDQPTINRIKLLNWWDYHIESLEHLPANHPLQFLEALECRINQQEIRPYKPKKLTLADI